MPITNIESYLVYPGKNMETPPEVKGTSIPLSGRLFNMLNTIYEKSTEECDIPIRFKMANDGSKQNDVQDYLVNYIGNPSQTNGLLLANRLRDCTTQKPGLALFFVILGKDGGQSKLVLSRFPADVGVVAEPIGDSIQVDYIEKIFMKNAKSYKSALYEGNSSENDFWSGYATDKQLNQENEVADYWIKGFLNSDFITTSKEGTRRFAIALRAASKKAPDLNTKNELVSLSILASGLNRNTLSINDIFNRFSLSTGARNSILTELSYPTLAADAFQFDHEEFLCHAAFSSVELNNGGIMLAPPDQFNNCFHKEVIDEESLRYRFTTEGQIVDERVRGRK